MSTKIADPNVVLDLKGSTMQQARANTLFNCRNQLAAAISDLQRVKQHSGRGNRQASYDGYLRAYARIEQHARRVFEMTGEESEVPRFDPPIPPGTTTDTVRLGKPDPFAVPDVAPKGAKPIPDDIKPGTARWYRIQGQTPPEGCPE